MFGRSVTRTATAPRMRGLRNLGGVERAANAAADMTLSRTVYLGAVAAVTAATMVVTLPAHAAVNTSRFATHAEVSGSDGKKATITLPAGYPVGELTAARENSVTVPTAPAFKNDTTDFETLFAPDSLNQNAPTHISLKSKGDGTVTENSAEIVFPTPVPANSLAINFVDADVEKVVINMFNGATSLTAAEINFKGAYEAVSSPTGGPSTWDPATFTLSGPGADTTGQAAWFNPTQPITRITLGLPDQGTQMTTSSVVYVWFAAIRPTPTIQATSVPAEYVIDDPALELLDSQFTITFPEHILAADFADDLGLTFAVTDQGGTGCSLTTGPPVTLTATDPGTCQLEASLPEETTKFFGATTPFSIPIVTEPTPPPPAPLSDTSRPSPATEPVVEAPGPELAATGAPAWPVLPAVTALVGVAMVVASRVLYSPRHRGTSA